MRCVEGYPTKKAHLVTIPTDAHLRRLLADIRVAVAKQDEIDAGRPEKTATNDRLIFATLTAVINRMLGEDEKETK